MSGEPDGFFMPIGVTGTKKELIRVRISSVLVTRMLIIRTPYLYLKAGLDL